jgi:hypothetical protein
MAPRKMTQADVSFPNLGHGYTATYTAAAAAAALAAPPPRRTRLGSLI